MSLFHDSALVGSSGQSTGYQISRSLRFNSSDSAYCSRVFSSAGNRKTWTLSWWMKRSRIGGVNEFIWGTGGSNTVAQLFFDSSERLNYGDYTSAPLTTAAVFRDASAWYHCVFSYDTTNATAADRIILYVNGTRALTSSYTAPTQNSDGAWNRAVGHVFGGTADGGSNSPQPSFNGYLADIHFIDGQALTPSSFAETNATTGQWVPKAYSGSYGTNGFQLKFADNSAATATTLGKDTSGNGNNWTPNNLSVTAGAGNDSLVDTPTSYGTDTGAGGEVRGNYCTWNPLDQGTVTLTNGNLDASATIDNNVKGTIAVPESTKIYFEFTVTQRGGGGAQSPIVGVCTPATANNQNLDGQTSIVWCYSASGQKLGGGAFYASYGNSLAANDVLGVAIDRANGRIWFSKNGTWQNSGTPTNGSDANAAFTNVPTTGTIHIVYGNNNTTPGTGVLNAGQRPFAYTAPSGFKALCDTNLPAPVVAKPNTVMDVKLYTGNGSTQTISGLGFSPDFVWVKARGNPAGTPRSNQVFDTVRGADKALSTNKTDAEDPTGGYDNDGAVTAFTSDGFTVEGQPATGWNASAYVAWTWDAGSSTVTNTQGSITSQVRANATAGFSIVTYTGTGATATVGHGLGTAPYLMIHKARNLADFWLVYHGSLGASTQLNLNATSAAAASTKWNNTAPTSTVFTVTNDGAIGQNAINYVTYCFAPVAGYSSFGSYTGNGSADGPFVYTGFKPAWLLIKRTDSTSDWILQDSKRLGYNVDNNDLVPNQNYAEATDDRLDQLSNGFKLRSTFATSNASGGTYIYAAFAESFFAYSRAR